MDMLYFTIDAHPDAHAGIYCAVDDPIINLVLGYGIVGPVCSPVPVPNYLKFYAGLMQLRRDVQAESDSFGTFYVHTPFQHTCMPNDDCFFGTVQGGVRLNEWTAEVLRGNALHVGPGLILDPRP